MGRFGISFSDENGRGFTVNPKRQITTVIHVDDEPEEGPFQRCLAWLSYIVMVLTASVTFSSTAQAGPADHLKLVTKSGFELTVPAQSENADISGWTLRSTR